MREQGCLSVRFLPVRACCSESSCLGRFQRVCRGRMDILPIPRCLISFSGSCVGRARVCFCRSFQRVARFLFPSPSLAFVLISGSGAGRVGVCSCWVWFLRFLLRQGRRLQGRVCVA